MAVFEVLLLVVGVTSLVAAIVLVVQERRLRAEQLAARPVVNDGLIQDSLSRDLIGKVPPGLLRTLIAGRAEMADVSVTLVDLAVRGYLRIEPLVDDGEPYDWRLTRTNRPADGLPDFEQTLLTVPFDEAHRLPDGTLATTISALVADGHRTYPRARAELLAQAVSRGWFLNETQSYRNAWGCAGGALLLLGLLTGAVMIVRGLITSSPAGTIGALLLAVTGVLIASRGRVELHTDSGEAAVGKARKLSKQIHHMQPSDIDLGEIGQQFSTLLPYAIALDQTAALTKVFDEVIERAGRWGGRFTIQLDWMDLSAMGLPEGASARACTRVIERFINASAAIAEAAAGVQP